MSSAIANPDIEASRAGDRRAIERLLTTSRLDLRRYAEYHCVINDIEDAVQESLLLVARSIGRLRVIEAFNSWLFRIVKRECNRIKRGMRYMDSRPVEIEIQPIPCMSRIELTRDLTDALESLPLHYRDVIVLRDMQGMTIDEICAQIGSTREAVKARLRRARLLAREYLDC